MYCRENSGGISTRLRGPNAAIYDCAFGLEVGRRRVTIGICTGGRTFRFSVESSPEGEAAEDAEDDAEGEEEEEKGVMAEGV